MEFEKIYRHGDVLIFRLPDDAQLKTAQKKEKVSSLTLALGEVTGHSHVLKGNLAVLSKGENTQQDIYFEVLDRATLTHEEHNMIVLEKGIYLKVNQVEYDPFNDIIRYVRD